MLNKKRLSIIFYLVIILFLFLLNMTIVSAQVSIIKSKEVESEILERLNETSDLPVIIKLNSKNNFLVSSILSELSSSEFRLKEKLLGNDGFAGNITQKGFNKLINNPYIKSIYLDKEWSILLQQSLPLINVDDVWINGYTGKGQTVCVIDTGINWSHSDLGGCIGSNCKVLDGYNEFNNDNNSMDDNGHGTNVAGIVAANGTVNGTAPGAKLIAMKACNAAGTSCPTSDIINSITWCINNKSVYNISVISISIGGGGYTDANCPIDARDEINDAYANNISVIIASGNNGFIDGISWPACRGNATSVGAVYDTDLGREPDFGSWTLANCFDPNTDADNITCFTNRWTNLDLLAPGCRINSTDIGGNFDYMCGTSQAAPHVAGAAALLLEADSSLTPDEIKQIFKDSGVIINDTFNSRNNGGSSNLTFSRIDVFSALDYVCDKDGDGYDSNTCSGGNDCNDYDANINLDAEEVCDGIDNNCDGNVDEGNICSPSIPTMLLCEGQPCTNNGTFSGSVEVNCSGSTDAENDSLTYFVYAYYNDSEEKESSINYFNNSLEMENNCFENNFK